MPAIRVMNALTCSPIAASKKPALKSEVKFTFHGDCTYALDHS
jgi:hypothetical protein